MAEVITKLVRNPKFAAMMQEKINMQVDTTAIDQEIANYEKQLAEQTVVFFICFLFTNHPTGKNKLMVDMTSPYVYNFYTTGCRNISGKNFRCR